jgi:hypothetical protein
MMGQLNPTPWLAAGHTCAGYGLMGRTIKALVGVIGEAAILSTFIRLMRGNSNAMLELVYATCGTAAGNLFSTMILRFIDLCAPNEQSQRESYLDLTKTTTFHSVSVEAAILLGAKIYGVDQNVTAENIYSHLPTIIQRIVTIDAAVADVIENYVSLRVMTTWLWKTDEQKADALIQASADQLSKTLDAVITDFIPSDPTLIPAHIKRFQASQTMPTIGPLELTEDDPLLSNDVAAITGIGKTQADALQKKLGIKKYM